MGVSVSPDFFKISTHAPLAGRDVNVDPCVSAIIKFQPTRPLRGATRVSQLLFVAVLFQPTRPLRGATDTFGFDCVCLIISTHAPLAGRDHHRRDQQSGAFAFQPTRPLRGATSAVIAYMAYLDGISTHAPLAGRDGEDINGNPREGDFNPRAPCGARRLRITSSTIGHRFQPTRPLRGATAKVYKSLCTFLR